MSPPDVARQPRAQAMADSFDFDRDVLQNADIFRRPTDMPMDIDEQLHLSRTDKLTAVKRACFECRGTKYLTAVYDELDKFYDTEPTEGHLSDGNYIKDLKLTLENLLDGPESLDDKLDDKAKFALRVRILTSRYVEKHLWVDERVGGDLAMMYLGHLMSSPQGDKRCCRCEHTT